MSAGTVGFAVAPELAVIFFFFKTYGEFCLAIRAFQKIPLGFCMVFFEIGIPTIGTFNGYRLVPACKITFGIVTASVKHASAFGPSLYNFTIATFLGTRNSQCERLRKFALRVV